MAPDSTHEERSSSEARTERTYVIRLLSVALAVMSGIIAGLATYIVAASQETSVLGAMGAAAGAFVAVSTLALNIEARLSLP